MSEENSTAELVEFDDPMVANQLFGPNNAHLHLLASASGAHIASRGAKVLDLRVRQALCNVFLQLYGLFKSGVNVTQEDIARAYEMVRSDPGVVLSEVYRDAVFIHTPRKTVTARNVAQKAYLDALRRCAMVFAVGPAGTGKTYLAVAAAVAAFRAEEVNRIILTRPAVEAGERLGFLQGDLQSKVDPYLRPLYDALFDMLGADTYQKYLERGNIEVAPLAYMRGRTLDDSFIILDEAQNTSREQMKMFLTRIGFGSKVVITGDITQIDLPETSKSGLIEALRVLNGVEDIAQNRFSEKDVVRHRLVQDIVRAYEKYSQANKPAEQNKKPYQNGRRNA